MKKVIFPAVFILVVFASFSQELPRIIMKTTLGDIISEVDTVNAPLTAYNFLDHVASGNYGNAVFYRVVRMNNQPNNDVKIEVIQGGIYTEPRFKEIKPIAHENTEKSGLQHLDGTLSMARAEPGTASTEFFICIGDQPELDFGGKRNPDGQGFAAFGKVVDGMEVVRKIQLQKDKTQTLLEPVRIEIRKIHE
jgi:peptidyl-prolyl cis-trans isomerase A (cyclophilin A)